MRKISIGVALAGSLLGLVACESAPAGGDQGGRAAAANSTAARPVAKPGPPAAPLVLEGAGLRIPGASPPRTLAFDTPKAATIDLLTQVLGGPPTERGTHDECGGGGLDYAAWSDRLTAWFEDDRFAGWDTKGELKTLQGIGIGSSRAELAMLPGIEVEESTLGTEFRAGGLSGILDSKGPDAKVLHLWGGATCVFR